MSNDSTLQQAVTAELGWEPSIRSATDVGHAATSAVVAGIVGVIALDTVFADFANTVGF